MLSGLIGMSRFAIRYYENSRTEPLIEDLKKNPIALDIEVPSCMHIKRPIHIGMRRSFMKIM